MDVPLDKMHIILCLYLNASKPETHSMDSQYDKGLATRRVYYGVSIAVEAFRTAAEVVDGPG
jgi:hypothetical protein